MAGAAYSAGGLVAASQMPLAEATNSLSGTAVDQLFSTGVVSSITLRMGLNPFLHPQRTAVYKYFYLLFIGRFKNAFFPCKVDYGLTP